MSLKVRYHHPGGIEGTCTMSQISKETYGSAELYVPEHQGLTMNDRRNECKDARRNSSVHSA